MIIFLWLLSGLAFAEAPSPSMQDLLKVEPSAKRLTPEEKKKYSGLPADIIDAVIQANRHKIRECYGEGLKRLPNMRGKVNVKFAIEITGLVSRAGILRTTLKDSNVEKCIVGVVENLKFPPPPNPVVTEVSNYPFYLKPPN